MYVAVWGLFAALLSGCVAAPPRWERQRLPAALGASVELLSVVAFEQAPGRALAVQRDGVTYETADAGRSWRPGSDLGDLFAGPAGRRRTWVAVANRPDAAVWALATDGMLVRSGDGGKGWWRAGKAPRGGVGVRLAARPEDTDRLVLGAADGSVWLSDDGGRSWRRIDAEPLRGAVRAVAIAPGGRGERFYVGTDVGLFRTNDGGKHWRRFDHPAFEDGVRAIRIHPHAQHVVAVLVEPAAGFTGVVVTRNAGAGWRLLEADMGGIEDLAFDARDPFRFFVLAGRRVFRSDDLGYHVRPVSAPGVEAERLVWVAGKPPTLIAYRGDGTLVRSP